MKQKTRKRGTRFLALLLSVLMMTSLLPAGALAANVDAVGQETVADTSEPEPAEAVTGDEAETEQPDQKDEESEEEPETPDKEDQGEEPQDPAKEDQTEQPEDPEQVDENQADALEAEDGDTPALVSSEDGWDGETTKEPAQVDGVYQIGTAEELAWFAAAVNAGTASSADAVLTDDIDLNNKEWTPIGNGTNKYSGTFDGEDHTVKNMSITVPAEYMGLFGYVDGGEIKNITVSGEIVASGYQNYSTACCIGGIVGWLCGNISNCTSNVDINISDYTVKSSSIGGICGLFGKMSKKYRIVACTNSGTITVKVNLKDAESGNAKAGGISGGYSGLLGDCKIEACRNMGDVNLQLTGWGKAYVSGITTINTYGKGTTSPINSCYNIGKLEVSGDPNKAGCTYASAGINALVATAKEKYYPLNCYYLKDTAESGMCDKAGESIGDNVSGTVGKTDDELKSEEFLALLNKAAPLMDHTYVWESDENGYPEVKEIKDYVGINSFEVAGVFATINNETHTITAELPEKTSLEALVPTITFSGAEAVEPASGVAQNFTDPVIYCVGDVEYTVILTVKEPVIKGSGTEEDPYIIDSAAALQDMSEKFDADHEAYNNKYWKQTAEIDMTGVKFSPIGRQEEGTSTKYSFAGHYDGGNFAIKNLEISSGGKAVGLFGSVYDAVIENVVIGEGSTITSTAVSQTGAVVGQVLGGSTIRNCVNYATVHGTAKYQDWGDMAYYMGGVVGQVRAKSLVLGCKNYGKVYFDSINFYAGGIAGSSTSESVIADCENHGEIVAPSQESYSGLKNGSYAGGIAGNSYDGYISGCWNDGSISGGKGVGGIIGLSDYNINENCYNLGTVTGIADDAQGGVGGIVGYSKSATIKNCYNAGKVTSPENCEVKQGQIYGYGGGTVATGNYFIGTTIDEGTGFLYNNFTEENMKPVTAEWLASDEAVAKLNEYGTPQSLYKVTWTKGTTYPEIGNVEKIKDYRNELLTFTVKAGTLEKKATIENNKITVLLPYGTTSIAPTITVSDNATVSPASGETVDLTNGPVTYTVTAENGDTQIYTFEPTIPEKKDGLSKLRLEIGYTDVVAADDFKQDTYEYSGDFLDKDFIYSNTSSVRAYFYATPAESGATMTATINGGEPVTLKESTASSAIVDVWGGTADKQLLKYGENTITLTVTPTDGSEATVYTVKFNIKPSVTGLTITNNKTDVTLDKDFDYATTDYTITLPGNVKTINVKASVLMEDKVTLTMPDGISENGDLDVSSLDQFEIKASDGTNTTTYTVHINKLATYRANVTTDPENAAFVLMDAEGNIVSREADGSYILSETLEYNWSAAAKGYAVQTGTIKQDGTDEYNLTVTLEKAAGRQPSAVSAEWPNFRGSDTNMAITSAKTARTAEEATEKWAVALGTGWSAAPSVQIIVDNSLVVMSNKKIYKVSMADGSILAEGNMVKGINWGYTPATYANGMIFAPLDEGTVQAFDANTLESLWVYTDPLGGQSLSPITYSDGYVYTGFWNSEEYEASYVCIPVTDEDATNTTEAQKALWRDVVQGGFYWAGSVVVGDYIVYGTDDGESGSRGTGHIISRNKLTGELLDSHEIVGDQRSSVAYADGKVYFTTKAGYLYSADLGADGKLNNLNGKAYPDYGLMSTSTPVVYNGYVYIGIAKDNFAAPYNVLMLDADTLEVVASVAMQGYPQCSMLLSTAYEQSDGKIYLYSTYNNNPGGITAIEVDQDAQTMIAREIYTPSHPQYCITSIVCDSRGTLYYKNDSGYIMAVSSTQDDSLEVQRIADQTYTGKKLTPAVDVYAADGVTKLVKGKDYTITYKNNVKVNAAKNADGTMITGTSIASSLDEEGFFAENPYAVITGKGNYTGTLYANFNILPADLEDSTVKAADQIVASAKAVKVLTSVKVGKTTLKEGRDYTVALASAEGTDVTLAKGKAVLAEAGSYTLTITGIGNYTGTVTRTIHVSDKAHLMQNVTIKLNVKSVPFVKGGVTLTDDQYSVTVKKGKEATPLVKDQDYTVFYTGNDKAGTAKINFIGMGEYAGNKTLTFKVTGNAFTAANVKIDKFDASRTYTGETITQEQASLSWQPKGAEAVALTEGEDYTVSYKNNENVGTATVTYTGRPEAGYTGTVKKTFKITAVTLDDSMKSAEMANISVPYTKAGARPADQVVLTYNGKVLVEGKDYTLTYANNKAAADQNKVPTITITGKGNFTGKLTQTFTITKCDVNDLEVSVASVLYKAKNKDTYVYQPKVTVKDAGKVLGKADVEVTYEGTSQKEADNAFANAQATVKGTGNYTGELTLDLTGFIHMTKPVTLTAKNIKVTLSGSLTYTGSQVTPKAKVVYTTADGTQVELTEGTDYIVSYGTNTTAGKNKGTVLINGMGDYSGTVKMNFTIASQQIGK